MDLAEIISFFDKLMVNIPIWSTMFAEFVGYVAAIATLLVRLTPTRDDDRKVSKFFAKVYAVVDRLPTIGLNPATKRLRDK